MHLPFLVCAHGCHQTSCVQFCLVCVYAKGLIEGVCGSFRSYRFADDCLNCNGYWGFEGGSLFQFYLLHIFRRLLFSVLKKRGKRFSTCSSNETATHYTPFSPLQGGGAHGRVVRVCFGRTFKLEFFNVRYAPNIIQDGSVGGLISFGIFLEHKLPTSKRTDEKL